MARENVIEPFNELYSREREGRCPECGSPHNPAWHIELVKIRQQGQAWKALISILILAGSLLL